MKLPTEKEIDALELRFRDVLTQWAKEGVPWITTTMMLQRAVDAGEDGADTFTSEVYNRASKKHIRRHGAKGGEK